MAGGPVQVLTMKLAIYRIRREGKLLYHQHRKVWLPAPAASTFFFLAFICKEEKQLQQKGTRYTIVG